MSYVPRKFATVVSAITSFMAIAVILMATEASAMPTDKTYKVAFVYECPADACIGLSAEAQIYHDILDDALEQDVDVYSPGSLLGYLSSSRIHKLTDYDYVFWYNDNAALHNPDDSEQLARRILRASMPTVVMDGPGFAVSKALGVVPETASGGVHSIEGDLDNPLCVNLTGYGNIWHPLTGNNEEDCPGLWLSLSESIEDRTYWVNLSTLTPVSQSVPYTRPLYSVDGSRSRTVALVDDRKHIVASGIRADLDPDNFVFSSTIPSPDPGNFLHRMISHVVAPTPGMPAIGQNIFTEKDWTTPSRGFDFKIERTYSSGTWNDYSYQGPSWASNHDQYIVWDRFNDTLTLFNGTGAATQMQMVQGDRPRYPAPLPTPEFPSRDDDTGEIRTFVPINGGGVDIAVYYPEDNENPATKANADLGVGRNEVSTCVGSIHSDSQRANRGANQEGFLVRDKHGNKAFFSAHEIRDGYYFFTHGGDAPPQMEDDDDDTDTGYFKKEIRTRGGELEFFRISYVEDSSGNRQEYHYTEKFVDGSRQSPEDLLWCVVDTEGRGYHFEVNWFSGFSAPKGPIPWLSAITLPFSKEGMENTHIEYENNNDTYSFGSHSLFLSRVTWPGLGSSDGVVNYTYGISEDNLTPLESGFFMRPLISATNRGGEIAKQFSYEPSIVDNFLTEKRYSLSDPPFIYYPGRLKTVSLGDSHTGATKSTYHYQRKEGRGDPDDLDETYARTTVVKNGIAQTVEVNGRLHVINRHEWYYSGHSSNDPTGNTPEQCSLSYPSDLETFDFSPLESCPGWTTLYLTNFDGQVVEEITPSGQVTLHKHLFDEVEAQLFPIDIDDLDEYPNMDERMLAFWKKYWHLRYWFSNEYLTETRSSDGTQSRSNSARFEPVFNHPVQVYWGEYNQEKVGYRYDYMDDGHIYPTIDVPPLMDWLADWLGSWVYEWFGVPTRYGMSNEELFALMGIPHAAANTHWPVDLFGLPSEDPLFGGIPWIESGEQCDRDIASLSSYWSWDESIEPTAGNVVCTIQPETSAHGESAARDEAVSWKAYDSFGRNIYGRNAAERETFVFWEDRADGTSLKTVYRPNDDGPYAAEETEYSLMGLAMQEHIIAGDDDEDIVRVHTYDEWGRLGMTEVYEGYESGWWGGSGSGVEIASRESFLYDADGNVVSDTKDRCPSGTCTDPGNTAGADRRRLQLHDGRGRTIFDCNEMYEIGSDEFFTCTMTLYGGNDQIEYREEMAGCAVPKSLDTASQIEAKLRELTLRGCDSKLVEYRTYDGRSMLNSSSVGYANDFRTTLYSHNPDRQVSASRDPEGLWTHREYDGLGQLVRETTGLDESLVPDGEAVARAMEYDWYGNIVKETAGHPSMGVATDAAFGFGTKVYDERQSLVASTVLQYELGEDPSSGKELNTYLTMNQVGQVIEEDTVAPWYSSTNYTEYDDLGAVKSVSEGMADTFASFERDALGRVLREVNVQGTSPSVTTVSEYEYDARNNVVAHHEVNSENESDRRVKYNEYDGLGFLVSTTDAKGQMTDFERNGMGESVLTYEHITEAATGYWDNGAWNDGYSYISVATTYDHVGRVIERLDAMGESTSFTLNPWGETISVERPDEFTKTFTLNDVGAMEHIAYSDGREFAMTLDRYNRPTEVYEGDGTSLDLGQTFTYHANGSLMEATDYNLGHDGVSRVTIERSWDTLGNMLSDGQELEDGIGDVFGGATQVRFQGARPNRMILPTETTSSDLRFRYSLDYPAQLQTVRTGGQHHGNNIIASYAWVGGLLFNKRVNVGDSFVRTRRNTSGVPDYNGFGELTRQRMIVDGTVVDNFEYDYNLNGRLTDEVDMGSTGRDVSYELDDLDRVVEYSGPAGDTAFNLDKVNNIRQKYDPATPPTTVDEATDLGIGTDGMNQVVSLTLPGSDYSREFEYDLAGRMTLDTREEGLDDDRTYRWDNHGRLVEVSREDVGTIASYAYDALGRRVRKVVEGDVGEVVGYLLYGDDVMEEHHTPMGGGDPWMLAVLHDPTAVDRYLRWDRYTLTSGGAVADGSLAPVIDIRNNVSAVVDGDGAIEPLVYDLHGNEMNPDHGDLYIPYRFAGRRLDEESGLYYNRTRYYSPELGRFISVDSIGIWGDLNNYGNGYAYVGNMGNGLLDPLGLKDDLNIHGAWMGAEEWEGIGGGGVNPEGTKKFWATFGWGATYAFSYCPFPVVSIPSAILNVGIELGASKYILIPNEARLVLSLASLGNSGFSLLKLAGVINTGKAATGLAGTLTSVQAGSVTSSGIQGALGAGLTLPSIWDNSKKKKKPKPVAYTVETDVDGDGVPERIVEYDEDNNIISDTNVSPDGQPDERPSPDGGGDFDPRNFKFKRPENAGKMRGPFSRSTVFPGGDAWEDDYNPWFDPGGNRIGSGGPGKGGTGPDGSRGDELSALMTDVPQAKAIQSMNLRMKQLSHSIGGDGGDPWGYCGTLPFRGLGGSGGGISAGAEIEGLISLLNSLGKGGGHVDPPPFLQIGTSSK